MNAGGIDLSSVVQNKQVKTVTDEAQVIDVPSLVLDVTDASFEQVMALSKAVPVVVALWSERSLSDKPLLATLESATRAAGGRILFAKAEVDSNPGIAQAFNAQMTPTVVAIVAGQAVPLFQGDIPESQVRELYQQLITLADKQGLVARAKAMDGSADNTTKEEPEINPAHEAALNALEAGEYETAKTEYERVLKNNPKDSVAGEQLARVNLLIRLNGVDAQTVRDDAAAHPDSVEAQLLVSDLDLSGGHVEDAFLRLLDLFVVIDEEAKSRVREHLLEQFMIVGQTDARVTVARAKLANLLF